MEVLRAGLPERARAVRAVRAVRAAADAAEEELIEGVRFVWVFRVVRGTVLLTP